MRFEILDLRFKIFIFALCSLFLSPSVFAQSNLTYEVKVGTTGDVAVLSDFPESYAGEKINISVQLSAITSPSYNELDFVFANCQLPDIKAWGDSIYCYTDEANTSWTVWRNHKEIKNRGQRVLVQNAYKTFEEYIRTQTSVVKYRLGWIWFVFAGLVLIGGMVYVWIIITQRRKEKSLSSVEQETLRRKRMGLRRLT